ncbi:carbamoyltransferase C-terminal domain-containing protein [Zhongshania aquimaris]|jgi:predicted NodU family carbamoyl transferase|uniref:3-hydroxymethylcephem carbamoyltransferase n=1 Tax=Zhongshania aquimaris TaxID=2857107 RepID=A0ABS6VN51_9GAMM|nr:carbamoyltransferase C-terminal domain-containing protein [Zhongshania aquimaris]MBW2939146.1 3-hydroxymethylcephem carbamoyltransferase [Zhongshania aquimaris]
MIILSYNPGHDGAFAYLEDGQLVASVESEKNSGYRYSPLAVPDAFNVFSKLKEVPDVLCRGGWWPSDSHLPEQPSIAGYRGVHNSGIIVSKSRLFGKTVEYFSSSHERSHLLCAFGMSNLPKGTPCYALLWEGVIGSFYEIDSELNITKLGDVMPEPGHRYALLYGLADPTFDKSVAEFSRFSDAGKLMALASFSKRSLPTDEEEEIITFLMQDCLHLRAKDCESLRHCSHYNVGLDDQEFRNFAGIVSDRIFDRFYQFAKSNMKKGLPLLISGGCGLNCDWNTKWRESNLFPEVFIPPVANDSGSAIGTAIDAQFYFTGNPKINWSVYSGLEFETNGTFDASLFDECNANIAMIADMLANNMIIGWVNGKYEIGPRALGNRSILASPFQNSTKARLNVIKQREQFRPIAPLCLEEDAEKWFDCFHPSPFMLYTRPVSTGALEAVTHVNGTARIQTVTPDSNCKMYELLDAFKLRTGYGVLCNTSLNFNGRGFINNIADLAAYTIEHGLDGFVIEGRSYMMKSSENYQAYLKLPNSIANSP